ncbi:histone H1.2-like [Rhineura floridana]|uniref:histone H1.2-like n=1 Tax=Rhineura floridana TaxID=261503 RepID=UPI002AC824FF|nr:histone H1.2-like [Rhineura floridana]
MGTVNETPVHFLLNNDGNSEPVSTDFFAPTQQEIKSFREPQPSCSGLQLKPASRSRSKGRDAHKPSFPWKFLLPRRGVSKIIFQVVASAEKRSGVSLQAIKKSVAATGYDLEKRKNYFKRVLRALVAKGLLRKLTGRGLTGSYAISQMMMKVLKRRRMKRRTRRKRRRKAMTSLKQKKASNRRRRKRRRSRRKKTKSQKSEPSEVQSHMLTTGGFHS